MSYGWKEQIKNKQSQELIGDPFATERQWLSACLATRERLPISQTNNSRQHLRLPLSVFASAAISYLFMVFVDLGYDLGYRLLERFYGQLSGFDQGIMALNSLAFIVLPLTFGLSFGAFKHVFRSSSKVWGSFNLLLIAIFSAVVMVGNKFTWLDLLYTTPWTFTSVSAGWLGMLFGEKLYRELRRRINVGKVLLSAIFTLLPFAVFSHFLPDLIGQTAVLLPLEILLYFTGLSLTAFVAVSQSKLNEKTGAILIGCLAAFPLILCNALNIAANLFSLFLDNFGVGASLGWRALASALFLNCLAFMALAVGGLFGWRRFRQKSPHLPITEQH